MTKRCAPLLAALAIGAIPFSVTLLFGQNRHHVIAPHARLLLNDTVADTWQPGKTRLEAITQRALPGGVSQAIADFTKLRADIASEVPALGESSNQDANLNRLLAYALAYQIYHKAGQDAQANKYAAAAWTGLTARMSPVYPIESIVVDSSGTATVSFQTAPNPPLIPGSYNLGIFGVENDAMNGPIGIASVLSATKLTYKVSSVRNTTFSQPGMMASSSWLGASKLGESARALSQWAYFYDWCYDWLVANGRDQYARDQIKAGYWSNTLTRSSTQFGQEIRESDFHNYTSIFETAILEAGIALYGDDALATTMLNEGIGYLWEGIEVRPATCCRDTFEFNVKKSIDVLTGGAMNWEGPTYWRAGTIRFLRAFEAFDSATGRANDIWNRYFSNVKNAGMYKIYLRDPGGKMANFGDGGTSQGYAGRDNFGMAILSDRFPDPHFVWMMANSPNDWNSGDSGQTGLVYKLIFYPYVNGPGSHDPSDLPLGAQFGPDVILRSGWGPNDTFITYTSSLPGVYHRHDDAGTFTVYRQNPLVLSQPYTLIEPAYSNYNRRTIGGNTLIIYDPDDCWKDSAATCGVDGNGRRIVNDGGQLRTLRRLKNQFSTDPFQISRAWSGSLYDDGRYRTIYGEVQPIALPMFSVATGYEHVEHDLTSWYVNSYSGSGDNPRAKVAAAKGVTRELVHFQPTYGHLDPLVIFDRVSAINPTLKKSWLMHLVNAPSVNGTESVPGDTTYDDGAVTQSDNGPGRVYVTHLLPPAAKVRTVGGNACAVIPIQGATNTNPALFYAPNHGLQVGEDIGISTGTEDSGVWPNWLLDRKFGTHTITTVLDSDHFTISKGEGSDGSVYLPWDTAFVGGTRPPSGPGEFKGQVYYQTGGDGNSVWQWDGKDWMHLTAPGNEAGPGYPSPVVYSHNTCNWSYMVDQLGPAGSGGAHLWNASMDTPPASARPNWRVEVKPSGNNATDYFLNVVTATDTKMSRPPEISLLTDSAFTDSAGPRRQSRVYGVQIVDTKGTYIAVFSASPARVAQMDYSAHHASAAKHVVTGLREGRYIVTQNARLLGQYSAGKDGSLTFKETGGGDFSVATATQKLGLHSHFDRGASPAFSLPK